MADRVWMSRRRRHGRGENGEAANRQHGGRGGCSANACPAHGSPFLVTAEPSGSAAHSFQVLFQPGPEDTLSAARPARQA